MPTVYKKKSTLVRKRKLNSAVSYELKVEARKKVLNKEMSMTSAAKLYGIPRTTLIGYVKNDVPKAEHFKSPHVNNQVFSTEQEKMLADYVLFASRVHYGLSKRNLRKLAYDFATANHIVVPATWDIRRIAGRGWIDGFMARHPQLSMRKPEATSLSRATSFNKTNVSAFYEKLKAVRKNHHFVPDTIWNIDETSVTNVQNPEEIIAERGVKRVGQATSAERGTLVTMCCGISAGGNTVPPFFVFPRVNFKSHMLYGAPPGSGGTATKSGWMTGDLFLQYLQHFIDNVRPSKSSPVLLIYDNHGSHVTIEVIDLAREHGIVLLTLPPHCSHRMQPLDVCVYGPFKTYYNTALDNWMTEHPGRTITIYDVPKLAAIAFDKAFSKSNITSAFKNTGIQPFNEQIFTEADFLGSYVSDRPPPVENPESQEEGESEQIVEEGGSTPVASSVETEENHFIEPQMIRPFPKALPRKGTRRGRKPGKPRILTSSPERNLILQETLERIAKNEKKGKKSQTEKSQDERKKKNAKKPQKRSSDDKENAKNPKKKKK